MCTVYRIPQITSVRVCTCAMARIVETQRPLFPLQFLNLSLCRPHCTQFTDGQLNCFSIISQLVHGSKGALLTHSESLSPGISIIFHVNMLYLTGWTNKIVRCCAFVQLPVPGPLYIDVGMGALGAAAAACRPRLSSTARGFWCLAILGLAQGEDERNQK